MKIFFCFVTCHLYLAFITSAGAGVFDPNNPAASGYELIFDDEFDSINSIDIYATGRAGYKWYTTKFFGSYRTTPPNAIDVSGGILTITAHDTTNWQLATAGPSGRPQRYVGQVFGGGFYAEARIAFDSSRVNIANGWPAFWSNSLQAMIGTAQWPGQVPGYDHHIEDDFFEYDTFVSAGPNSFGSSMHDWYGIYNTTCPQFCKVSNNHGIVHLGKTTWTDFHTVGQLYTAGNSANKFRGSATTFFDGVATPVVITWRHQREGQPPPAGDLKFSVFDRQTVVIILGTGIGVPMRVDWVRVWQLAQPH